MTDQKTPESPQERPEGGSAMLESPEGQNGPQAGAESLGLREVIAGAIWDANSIHPGTIADAVWRALQPHLAGHYQHAVDAAVAAEQRATQAEAERKTLGQTALGYQQRAWDAEAAIRRVRAVVEALCSEPHPIHDHICPDDVRKAIHDAIRPLAEPARCCGKPAGAICVHDVTPPAHTAGPSVRECAEADARWWGAEKAGE